VHQQWRIPSARACACSADFLAEVESTCRAGEKRIRAQRRGDRRLFVAPCVLAREIEHAAERHHALARVAGAKQTAHGPHCTLFMPRSAGRKENAARQVGWSAARRRVSRAAIPLV